MKRTAPDYYDEFRCIAGQCKHSCCIGWEIDIDEETLEKYRNVPGDFGRRIAEGIVSDGETASFRLGEAERCPFLNRDGLCDMILNLGEEYLCQICSDHPRFRNFFSDREEIGLGLCCEEAARLILGREDKTKLIVTGDSEEELDEFEAEMLEVREQLFALAQNRELSLNARISQILEYAGKPLPDVGLPEWAEFYRALERLDPAWDECLNALQAWDGKYSPESCGTAFEQLLVYFLYRHPAAATDEWEFTARTLFCVHATLMIMNLCAVHESRRGACSLEDAAEYARMYSSEIEYSEENLQAILDALMQ